MNFQFITILILICVCGCTMLEIDLGDIELQKNILKFGYDINYKYMGTISHSFDRVYEIALILPTFTKKERQKRGILMSLITGFIGLAYEGTSSFLHYKRQKALHKAVHAMENKVDIQHNKIFHLEDTMVMYGICITLIL